MASDELRGNSRKKNKKKSTGVAAASPASPAPHNGAVSADAAEPHHQQSHHPPKAPFNYFTQEELEEFGWATAIDEADLKAARKSKKKLKKNELQGFEKGGFRQPPSLSISDLCERIGAAFGFQRDNVKSQAEHLTILFRNAVDRLDDERSAVRYCHTRMFSNYRHWYTHLKRRPISLAKSDDLMGQATDLVLYLLIWGEGANLRLIAECMCFVFHKLKTMYRGGKMSDKPANWYFHCVAVPMYRQVQTRMGRKDREGRLADHDTRPNYDDINEYYWKVKALKNTFIEDAEAIMSGNAEEEDALESGGDKRAAKRRALARKRAMARDKKPLTIAKARSEKTFSEKRSWWHVYRSFWRVLALHVAVFHVCILVGVGADSLHLSLVIINLATMSLFYEVIELYFRYGTIRADGLYCAVISRFLWKIGTLVVLSGLWYLVWSGQAPDTVWWTASIPYMLFRVFFELDPARCYSMAIFRALSLDDQTCMDKDIPQKSALTRFWHLLFWVFLFSCKSYVSYFVYVRPQLLLMKDLSNHKPWFSATFIPFNTNYIVSAYNWVPSFLVFLVDTQIFWSVSIVIIGLFGGAFQQVGGTSWESMRQNFAVLWKEGLPKLVSGSKTDDMYQVFGHVSRIWGILLHNMRQADEITDRDHHMLSFARVQMHEFSLKAYDPAFDTDGPAPVLNRRIFMPPCITAGEFDNFLGEFIRHFPAHTTYTKRAKSWSLKKFAAGRFWSDISTLKEKDMFAARARARRARKVLRNRKKTGGKDDSAKDDMFNAWKTEQDAQTPTVYALEDLRSAVLEIMRRFAMITAKQHRSAMDMPLVAVIHILTKLDNGGHFLFGLRDAVKKVVLACVNACRQCGVVVMFPVLLQRSDIENVEVGNPRSDIDFSVAKEACNVLFAEIKSVAGLIGKHRWPSSVSGHMRHFQQQIESKAFEYYAPAQLMAAAGNVDGAQAVIAEFNARQGKGAETRQSKKKPGSQDGLGSAGDYVSPDLAALLRVLSHVVDTSALDARPPDQITADRLHFFINSLTGGTMPTPPPVSKMYSWSVLTPFYDEHIVYSAEEMNRVNEDGVTQLEYLQSVYLGQWLSLLERLKRGRLSDVHAPGDTPVIPVEAQSGTVDPNRELVLWTSHRGQTLSRTVRGMMTYYQALNELAALEDRRWDENPTDKQARLKQLVMRKFQYVVSCQIYGDYIIERRKYKTNTMLGRDFLVNEHQFVRARKADAVDDLLRRYPHLRVAYIDKRPSMEVGGGTDYYSVLIKYADGQVQMCYEVRLPGNPILGEGKPENQNHAVIFTRGEILQTIDMNQDNYFEDALKMRNLLEEFSLERSKDQNNCCDTVSGPAVGYEKGLLRYSIIGFREYIFTSNLSSLAAFISLAEFAFVTISMRFFNYLGVRMHYGHPDLLDKLYFLGRGGLSKASKQVNVNEDIFAGYKSTLRKGKITHKEYIQCGKGRDLGFAQLFLFEGKLAAGAAEQGLSRDIYRLGRYLGIARLMSLYYASVGWYSSVGTMVIAMFMFSFAQALIAVSGKEGEVAESESSRALNLGVMNGAGTFQLGMLMILPILAEIALEKSFFRAVGMAMWLIVTGSPMFFVFHMMTKAHFFASCLFFGGAKYRSTGRGFVIEHETFVDIYRMYGRSHIYPGVQMTFLLLLYAWFSERESYFRVTWSGWVFALSWVFAPIWFNPLSFKREKVWADMVEWASWMNRRSSNDKLSWEAWWRGENVHWTHASATMKLYYVLLQFFGHLLIVIGVAFRLDVTVPRSEYMAMFVGGIGLMIFTHLMLNYCFSRRRRLRRILQVSLACIAIIAFILVFVLPTANTIDVHHWHNLVTCTVVIWVLLSMICNIFVAFGLTFSWVVSLFFVTDLMVGAVLQGLTMLAAALGFSFLQTHLLYNRAFASDLKMAEYRPQTQRPIAIEEGDDLDDDDYIDDDAVSEYTDYEDDYSQMDEQSMSELTRGLI